MGSFASKFAEANKKTMAEAQSFTLQRQIQMQNQMRERAMAATLGRARELFNWLAAFYGTTAFFGIVGFLKTKKPAPLVPLFPLTFILAYQWDLCYGNKMQRIRDTAEMIMLDEPSLLEMPFGLPTLESIDNAVATQMSSQK